MKFPFERRVRQLRQYREPAARIDANESNKMSRNAPILAGEGSDASAFVTIRAQVTPFVPYSKSDHLANSLEYHKMNISCFFRICLVI